jgi:hypothetical protein
LKDTSYARVPENLAQANSRNPHAILILDIGDTLFSSLAKAGRANTFHTLDTPLTLGLKGIEGGFIPATPTASQFRKKFDELGEAPVSGYRRQLEVRPSETDGVFFYCKIGDYYGKGYLVRPTFEWIRGNGIVRTDLEIYLNPTTGSRNLKSHL